MLASRETFHHHHKEGGTMSNTPTDPQPTEPEPHRAGTGRAAARHRGQARLAEGVSHVADQANVKQVVDSR